MKMLRSAASVAALLLARQSPAFAGPDPFLGEIMMLWGDYPPRW